MRILYLTRLMCFDGIIKKKPTILIFDSGVGGLSIYDEVRKILPYAHYLYVFDNEAFPYGEKPQQFIIDRVVAIIDAIWLLHQIDLIIVACNTASTISLPALRKRFPCEIIGVVPAIKPATSLTRNGIVGLLATHATIHHSYTYNLINQFASDCQILQLSMSKLVEIAEAKLQGEMVQQPMLCKLLRPWLKAEQPPDTIILGCTHFPLLSQELKAVLPAGTHLVNSGSAIARRAAWLVTNNMDINDLREGMENVTYRLANTPQSMMLKPVLMRYGLGTLKNLTL
ncbi:glutamate racemase [Sodalis endosymbiont of Henestaris halophilus]|uniref:glutamate racemase n=1 Tax=Sodalis endosymbiont of Henestaris halophilus TaxID=1929246 RepID=UPI000BBFCE4E|nr:glutamate racemase [Sodalis endosymbiont of Henestaris halophilus]SNC58607.1 Glutamate racemase [Sodalis endosymbiont of Henestaris halophilus]